MPVGVIILLSVLVIGLFGFLGACVIALGCEVLNEHITKGY